jgi:aquaporin NIP
MEKSKITKKYTAEFIGIFAIVFCGKVAIIINQETSGGISHVGIAATFGLIVMYRVVCNRLWSCH